VTRLHTLIGEHLPTEWAHREPAQAAALVKVGIETDRGPWVAALVASGYEVFAINPMSVARYRELTLHLGGEVRHRRRSPAGRDRATAPGASPTGCRRQRGPRRRQHRPRGPTTGRPPTADGRTYADLRRRPVPNHASRRRRSRNWQKPVLARAAYAPGYAAPSLVVPSAFAGAGRVARSFRYRAADSGEGDPRCRPPSSGAAPHRLWKPGIRAADRQWRGRCRPPPMAGGGVPHERACQPGVLRPRLPGRADLARSLRRLVHAHRLRRRAAVAADSRRGDHRAGVCCVD
jgi:hypothetical protein